MTGKDQRAAEPSLPRAIPSLRGRATRGRVVHQPSQPQDPQVYQGDIRDLSTFAGIGGPRTSGVTRAQVIAWRDQLIARELGPATIRCKLAALSSLYAATSVTATPSRATPWWASAGPATPRQERASPPPSARRRHVRCSHARPRYPEREEGPGHPRHAAVPRDPARGAREAQPERHPRPGGRAAPVFGPSACEAMPLLPLFTIRQTVPPTAGELGHRYSVALCRPLRL